MPVCSLDDLLGCLAIEATGEGGYTAPNLELPYHRIFGGQLVAQAIAIATAARPHHQSHLRTTKPPRFWLVFPIVHEISPLPKPNSYTPLGHRGWGWDFVMMGRVVPVHIMNT